MFIVCQARRRIAFILSSIAIMWLTMKRLVNTDTNTVSIFEKCKTNFVDKPRRCTTCPLQWNPVKAISVYIPCLGCEGQGTCLPFPPPGLPHPPNPQSLCALPYIPYCYIFHFSLTTLSFTLFQNDCLVNKT